MTNDADTKTVDELSQLPDARVPPKLPRWWFRLCWGLFVLGVFATLVCLTAVLWHSSKEARVAWAWPVLIVAWAAFPAAAANTWIAANQFSKRRDAMKKLIQSFTQRIGDKETTLWDSSGDFGVRSIPLADAGRGDQDRWRITARGDCQPEPYREPGTDIKINYYFKFYIELLEAEVHQARTSAAKLAAALGGLFVAALQVYSRLIG